MSAGMDRPVSRARWRSRRAGVAAGAAAVLCVVGFMAVAFVGPARRSVRVDARTLTIEAARRGVFHDFTPLQGKVAPKDTLYLDALEGGQVQAVLVQAGDRVAAGQPLVRFRNTEVELDVLNREAVTAQSLTQTQQYETQLEANRAANAHALAQIDYDIVRLKRAADRRAGFEGQGVFPQEQIDQYRDQLDLNHRLRPVQLETNRRQDQLRRAQLPLIHEELARLQQSLGRIRARLDDLTVKAPMAGRVTVMDLKVGQNANRGERLAELVPDTGFKVSAEVDEYYLARVRLGQTADATVEGRAVRLKVSRIYPQVKNGVFTADLVFEGGQPSGLTPGEAVQGRLSLGDDRPALVLPAGAFLDRSGGDYAFVATPDGRRADRRRIRIGRRNSEEVEVLAGLKAGERVVTSDYETFEKLDRIDFR
jgi:HlyD family secretion protein